ncbi:MAG: DUF3644 domain-containing protein [Sphingobacteriales bacterium]|nr:DUF3644 domain-containing protein [Sphingobacteriales bacterium]
MKHISRQLIDKSQEAIILALETYNKPTIKYRIEGFCFFYTNAWELILKAKIIEDNKSENSIYYKKVKGQLRKSLSLRDCLRKVFTNENDPIRTNIETVADIRDSATHFIIEELESIYSGLFQAGILNYVDKLNEWFDGCITDKCSPALMTLVGDSKDIDPIKIKKKYGPTILEFVEAQMTELNKRENKIGNSKFRIPVEYKLVLTKVEGDADIKLTASTEGAKSALVVEVAKNPNKTHPNLMKHILIKVSKKIKTKFTQYDFQAVLALEKIKGNGKFHFELDNPITHRYSDELVEFIANKIQANGQYLENNKRKYGELNKQKRKKPSR